MTNLVNDDIEEMIKFNQLQSDIENGVVIDGVVTEEEYSDESSSESSLEEDEENCRLTTQDYIASIELDDDNVEVYFPFASTPKSPLALSLKSRADLQVEEAKKKSNKSGRLANITTTAGKYMLINPYHIKVREGSNPRNLETTRVKNHIDTLARSIAAIGVQRALLIKMVDDVPYLEDGNCRLLATFRAIEVYGASIETVRCELVGKYSDPIQEALTPVVQNSGLSLTKIELAFTLKRAMDLGATVKDLAKRIGYSVFGVENILKINTLSMQSKKLVEEGKISASLAIQVSEQVHPDQVDAVIESAVEIANSSVAKDDAAPSVSNSAAVVDDGTPSPVLEKRGKGRPKGSKTNTEKSSKVKPEHVEKAKKEVGSKLTEKGRRAEDKSSKTVVEVTHTYLPDSEANMTKLEELKELIEGATVTEVPLKGSTSKDTCITFKKDDWDRLTALLEL